MARHSVIGTSQRDIAAIDLNNVLVRLEKKILSAEADPKLQRSSYERTRTSSNLEYARTLLIRLEQDTLRNQSQARKAAEKSALSRQRALLKRLTDRMHELEQIAQDDDSIYGPEEGEPLSDIEDEAPPSQPRPSHDTDTLRNGICKQPPSPPSTLRNRFAPSKPPISSPFPQNSPDPAMGAAQRLQNADLEHNEITSSLFSMAQKLKAESKQFQAALSTDDEVLRRAGEGLDKGESGMEAATKRMGMLKRMSEGKGLWGRMMLYAWILGLWVVAILLVFVGPKLRF